MAFTMKYTKHPERKTAFTKKAESLNNQGTMAKFEGAKAYFFCSK